MKTITRPFPPKYSRIKYIIINGEKYINSGYKPINPQNGKERSTC